MLLDGVAKAYWDRFLGLVQFVDDQGSVWDYLDLYNVRPCQNKIHCLKNPAKEWEDRVVAEEDGDDPALLFVAKEKRSLQKVLARLNLFEEKMDKKSVEVGRLGKRSDASAAKARYELARMKAYNGINTGNT